MEARQKGEVRALLYLQGERVMMRVSQATKCLLTVFRAYNRKLKMFTTHWIYGIQGAIQK